MNITTQQLTDKEISIIEEIHKNPEIDQRTIAQNVGLSLGLTNLIIKRLVNTGYIKIKQLNKRKVKYILTPKGFVEKAKKTYNYILKTTSQFFTIYRGLKKLILKLAKNGKYNFLIYTDDEIFELIKFVFKLNNLNIKYERIYELPKTTEINNSYVYIILSFKKYRKIPQNPNVVDLLSYLYEKDKINRS